MSKEVANSLKKMTSGPLDGWYGPYTSAAEACAAIPNELVEDEEGGLKNMRMGKVIGLPTDGGYPIADYHWPGPDFSDTGLIEYDKTKGQIEIDDEGDFKIIDPLGFIGLILTKLGVLKVNSVDVSNIKIEGSIIPLTQMVGEIADVLESPGYKSLTQSTDGSFLITDSGGYIGLKLTSDGTLKVHSIDAGDIKIEGQAIPLVQISADIQSVLASAGFTSINQTADGSFYISDANGFIGLKLGSDGILQVASVKLSKLLLGNAAIKDDAAYVLAGADPNGNLAYAITKLSEFIIKDVRAAGTVKAKNLVISDSFSLPPSLKVPFAYGTPSDYCLVIGYGQSNSLGGGIQSVITNVQKYDSLMPRGRLPVVVGGDYGDFVPLIEQTSETPMSAAFEKFIELVRDENFSNFNKKGFQLIGTTPGVGDTTIANLSKGSAPYAHLIENVTKCYELAKSKGGSFTVPYIYWTHGEADVGSNTTYSAYLSALNQLITDLNTDILAITGQKNNIPLIADQVSWNNMTDLDKSRISKAILDVSISNPYFICACPTYFFDYDIQSEVIHFSAKYRRIYGAYLGIAAKKLVVDGVKFKPLMPIGFIVSGNNLQVIFNVPVGSIKIDSTLVSDPGNYGIQVYNSSGTLLALTNIKVVSRDTLSIDCSASPIGGTYSYARNARSGAGTNIPNPDGVTSRLAARGCLRDTQGDTIIFDNYPMHNWAVASYLTII